jgi:hypothetical protein
MYGTEIKQYSPTIPGQAVRMIDEISAAARPNPKILHQSGCCLF